MAAALDQPPFDPIAGAPATDAASITPPQSVNGKKEVPDGVPSELSDLELDPNVNGAQEIPSVEADDEEIEPDHYYGGGKIPVFKPVSPPPYYPSWPRFGLMGISIDYGSVPRLPIVHQQGRGVRHALRNHQSYSS